MNKQESPKSVDRSEIARRSARALWANCEAVAKLKAKRQALWQDPDYRKRQREARGEEWRDKIRQSHLGRKNPMYGRRGELSPSCGLKRSQQTRMKIKLANERNRQQLSISRTASGNPMWGKKITEETRAKLSAVRKGNHYRSGTHQPEGWGQRHSLIMKALYQNPEYKAKQVKATIAGSHLRPNRSELKLQRILDTNFPREWKYVGDGQLIIGGRIPDFVNVNGKKEVIELFGSYWHPVFDVAKKKDHYRQYGFKVAIIWEDELKDEPKLVKSLIRRLK